MGRGLRVLFCVTMTISLFALAGCHKADAKPEGIEFNVDASSADSLSIFYGGICYNYVSENREDIERAAALFQGVTFAETDETLDADTTYEIYFTNGEGQVAAFEVDEKGVVWNAETKKFYRAVSGEFDFNGLREMYMDSMEIQGMENGLQPPQECR